MNSVFKVLLMLSLVAMAAFVYDSTTTSTQHYLKQRIPGGNSNNGSANANNQTNSTNNTAQNQTNKNNSKNNATATIFEWANCQDSVCNTTRQPNICLGTDRACLLQSYYYSTCVLSNQNCLEWNNFFQYGQSNDRMPDSYFSCQEACKPNASLSPVYYTRFECGRKCAAGSY